MDNQQLSDAERVLIGNLLADHVHALDTRQEDASLACEMLDDRIKRVLRELPVGADHSVVEAMFTAERESRCAAYIEANRQWSEAEELRRRVANATSISLADPGPVILQKRRASR